MTLSFAQKFREKSAGSAISGNSCSGFIYMYIYIYEFTNLSIEFLIDYNVVG